VMNEVPLRELVAELPRRIRERAKA